MRNLKLLVLATLTSGFFVIMGTGCKKGDTGPVGPAGPDSVQYSAWTSLNMSFAGFDSNSDSVFVQTITASSITSAIVNKGSVIGYFQIADPLTGDSSIINASLALEEYVGVGKIDLVSHGVDWSGVDYRYVIIPGKVATTSTDGPVQNYTSAQLKGLDYSTLTSILHIPAKGSSPALNTTN